VTRTARLFSRIALLGALAAAISLGGCGRKGPLDAPPGGTSSVQSGQAAAAGPEQVTPSGQQQNSQGGNLIDRGNSSGLPRVKGEDKRIPLDVLLN